MMGVFKMATSEVDDQWQFDKFDDGSLSKLRPNSPVNQYHKYGHEHM